MKITELRVANFKRVELVAIQRGGDGPAIIAGDNGHGKSSTLDALNVLLWGKTGMPPELARKGTDGADLRVVFDSGIVIERHVSPAGLVTAKITTEDGMSPAGGPQAWLDARLSKTACDPLALLNLPAAKLAAELSRIVGLDTAEIDGKRARVYEDRTVAGRLLKAAEGVLASTVEAPHGTPDQPVSSADIAAEIAAAGAAENSKAAHLARAEECARGVEVLNTDADGLDRQADDLRKRAAALNKEAVAKRVRTIGGEAAERKARADAEAVVIPDVEDAQQRLAAVDETNAAVLAKAAWLAAKATADERREERDTLTGEIEALDTERKAMLAAAEWPVDGLSVEDGKVTLNELPFGQASQAERLRVAVALALAGDPEIPVVLVRDGSLLDDISMGLLSAAVAEHGGDLWIERVGTGDAGAIVIEDGRNVVEVTA